MAGLIQWVVKLLVTELTGTLFSEQLGTSALKEGAVVAVGVTV
jgi:hypothetical protein